MSDPVWCTNPQIQAAKPRPVVCFILIATSSNHNYLQYNQAKYGDVDVITGDYLAGVSASSPRYTNSR